MSNHQRALDMLDRIIRPACDALNLGGPAAEAMVLGTFIKESDCGRYILQLPRSDGRRGPALGPGQMEPFTHDDLHRTIIAARPGLRVRLNSLCLKIADSSEMVWNWRYAAAMCRILYFRVRAPLPGANDLGGQAAYWKRYYNTVLGAGTESEYIASWNRYMGS